MLALCSPSRKLCKKFDFLLRSKWVLVGVVKIFNRFSGTALSWSRNFKFLTSDLVSGGLLDMKFFKGFFSKVLTHSWGFSFSNGRLVLSISFSREFLRRFFIKLLTQPEHSLAELIFESR